MYRDNITTNTSNSCNNTKQADHRHTNTINPCNILAATVACSLLGIMHTYLLQNHLPVPYLRIAVDTPLQAAIHELFQRRGGAGLPAVPGVLGGVGARRIHRKVGVVVAHDEGHV